MKRKLTAMALAAALCLSPALAAEEAGLFPNVKTYPGFSDVAAGSYYAQSVQLCYETGLMKGVGGGTFQPKGTVSVAQAATIAARIREKVTGEAIPTLSPADNYPWYQGAVDYLERAGVPVPSPAKEATRQEFFRLLSAVVPEGNLEAINSIQTLPDTADAGVLRFYNAGILTGVDKYGTFNPNATLTRADCATMLARVIQPDLRRRFTPAVQAPLTYTEELAQTMALQVNGKTITVSEYMSYLNRTLDNLAYSLQIQGRTLDWSLYGSETLVEQYKSAAMDSAVAYCLAQSKASALGCTVAQLPEKLTPDPGREVLQSYAQSTDKLAAKHILVTDEALANSIVESLNAKPTQEQFDNLLALYGTDPGMKQSPQGYLFTAGDMVSEFEAGTRALAVGSYSKTPVKSQFGYHIIWRLDPVSLPDLLEEYRQRVFSQQLQSWVLGASVTVNEKTLELLDSDTIWASYLAYRETLSK